MGCLVQQLSKFTLWPVSQGRALTRAVEALTIHRQALYDGINASLHNSMCILLVRWGHFMLLLPFYQY